MKRPNRKASAKGKVSGRKRKVAIIAPGGEAERDTVLSPARIAEELVRIARVSFAGFALEVRSALQGALQGGWTVRREGIELHHDSRVTQVNLDVRPLTCGGPGKFFPILFEPPVPEPLERSMGRAMARAVKRKSSALGSIAPGRAIDARAGIRAVDRSLSGSRQRGA